MKICCTFTNLKASNCCYFALAENEPQMTRTTVLSSTSRDLLIRLEISDQMLVRASAWQSQHPVRHRQTCTTSNDKKISQRFTGCSGFTWSKAIANQENKNIPTQSPSERVQETPSQFHNLLPTSERPGRGQAETRTRATASITSEIFPRKC